MAGNKISSKQIVSKDVLKQLYKQSEYFANDTDNIELDNLLRAIDSAVTPPLRMYETATPDLVLNIENVIVSNTETDIRRAIPLLSNILPAFSSGTVTFPASSGGNATPSAGGVIVITVSSGNFIKVGINLDSTGDIVLQAGTEGASEAAATVPSLVTGTFPIGYVVLENVGGVIQNISNDRIVQYIGAGAGVIGSVVGTSDTQDLSNKTFTDAITLEELSSTPSTPSAGDKKIYAKDDGKLYQLDSLGIESELGSGSGSGELNLIADSDSADNWAVSGASTVLTTSSSSFIPLYPEKLTAIRFNPSGTGGDYIRYRFQMPVALKNTKQKISLYQLPGAGYVSGNMKLDLFTNSASDYSGSYDRLPLSTDSSSVTGLPNLTGQFITSVDSDDSDYYELRITSVSGTASVNFNSILVGPGSIKQGAVITPWEDDTSQISLTNFGTGAAVNAFRYRRVGNSVEFYGQLTAGSGPAGSPYIQFTNYTMDTSLVSVNNLLGNFKAMNPADSSASNVMGVLFYDGINNNRLFTSVSSTSNNLNKNQPLANTGKLTFKGSVPIAEWAGSGTVNLGENDVEYAYNSSTTDAADTTSFAYGPGGGLVPSTLTASRSKRIRFQSPIGATDELVLEYQEAGNDAWIPVANDGDVVDSLNYRNTTSYGIGLREVSGNSTYINVIFGQYSSNYASTYAGAGQSWSTRNSAGDRWRVKKTRAGQAVGFGEATPTSLGLVKKRRFQQKFLGANYASTTPNEIITFNNLTVGKVYTFTAQVYGNWSTTTATILIRSGTTEVSRHRELVTGQRYFVQSITFVAVDTTANLYVALGAGITVYGGGTTVNTFATLVEEADTEETTDFT